ncbi:MAG: T9SS type A sorting domain-containing protein [Bacteroidota bacterium]
MYIFERQTDGAWAEVDKVRDPDPVRFGLFGSAVALDGDRMLVAAERSEDPATDYEGGTVYVFDRQPDGTWVASATLQRPETEGRVGFGDAVALDGDRALIGAGGTRSSPVNRNGRAYVYDRTGSTWTEVAKLESPDGTVANNNKQFGEAVALDGDVALVGASGQGVTYPGLGSFASGAAYLFERDGSGGWPLRQRLTPDDLDRSDLSSEQIEFGFSVALDDGIAVIGAKDDDLDGAIQSGSAYVFEDDGGTWSRTAKLRGGGRESTNFGFSMSMSDGSVVTGEIRGGDPDTEPGVAHIHVLIAPPPPPLSLTVRESIGVTDAPGLVQALMLMVQERIGVSDGPTVARADGSAASGTFPIRLDSARVAFVGPVGLGIAFNSVTAPGGVSVLFEALAPEGAEGIPEGVTLAPYRWRLAATDGLAFDSARVAFAPEALPLLDVTDPEAVTVYRRPEAGTGPFAPLRTEVDAESGAIVGTGLEGFSEFALAGTGFTVGTEPEAEVPLVFGLSAPAPNPARGRTRFLLSLPEAGPVQVDLLDLLGRRVATLVEGELPAGQTAVEIRADRLATGSYVVVLRAGGQLATSRLTVVR